jgi:SAM-dependent methyltransferase
MSAQDDTLNRYHTLMRINAEAQLLRTARRVGVIDRLLRGQATAAELIDELQLDSRLAPLLLDALVALQVLEKYGDDYALAAVARLLCEYDRDLGDRHWEQLADQLRRDEASASGPTDGDTRQEYFDAAAATQWIHTGAAKQAAEMLDIGGGRAACKILDLGCGSAVWSAAMAYRDPLSEVTAIDLPQRLPAAKRTVESIDLGDRYQLIGADPLDAELPAEIFDLVILGGRLSGYDPQGDETLFRRIRETLRSGGELAVMDLFRGPGEPGVNEAVEALVVAARTPAGFIRDAEQMRGQLVEAGFADCQFAFLAASRQGYGVLVARKNS